MNQNTRLKRTKVVTLAENTNEAIPFGYGGFGNSYDSIWFTRFNVMVPVAFTVIESFDESKLFELDNSLNYDHCIITISTKITASVDPDPELGQSHATWALRPQMPGALLHAGKSMADDPLFSTFPSMNYTYSGGGSGYHQKAAGWHTAGLSYSAPDVPHPWPPAYFSSTRVFWINSAFPINRNVAYGFPITQGQTYTVGDRMMVSFEIGKWGPESNTSISGLKKIRLALPMIMVATPAQTGGTASWDWKVSAMFFDSRNY